MKICTFCKQEASDDAIECPFCSHAVVGKEQANQSPEKVATTALSPLFNLNVGTLFFVGILLLFLGLFLIPILPPIGFLIQLVGSGFYFAGCWKFTNNKGWNGWLGVFLGITVIGLVVMAILEDKTKQSKQPDSPKV